MKHFEWGAAAGLGIAGLLVAAQPARATEEARKGSNALQQTQQQGGSSTMGAEKTSPHAMSPAGQPQNQLTGKVETYDRVNRTLTLANSGKKLKLTDDTEVYKDGTRRSPGAIMEGDEVRASYSGSGDALQVQRLDVVKPGSAPSR